VTAKSHFGILPALLGPWSSSLDDKEGGNSRSILRSQQPGT
jgi:hypothetical protein